VWPLSRMGLGGGGGRCMSGIDSFVGIFVMSWVLLLILQLFNL
jgi:hypothetical protein